MKNYLNKFSVLFYNPILIYFFLLVGISLLSIYSSYPLSQAQYKINNNFVFRQLLFYGIGSVILITVLVIGIERIRALRWWIYGFIMLLLVGIFIQVRFSINVPFVFGTKGATRWYNFGPLSIQPSEFMRIALILVVADITQKHNQVHSHFKRTAKTDFILIGKVMAVVLPPCFLIYMQPDSGITLLILATTAIMLLAAGVQWRYILSVGGIVAFIITAFIIIVSQYPDFLIDTVGIDRYRIARFNGWFDPFGTISGDGHQLALGMVAIGSGGLLGNGLQSGLIYFPESHTDFIFAIIGKDFGLLGALAIVALYGLFNFEILNTAVLNRGRYNGLACAGIFASFLAQQFWNIGMCIGLLPISGVTLPFISHGGSSVLSCMILLGLVLSSYVEGAKIKSFGSNYKEHILYLKTKGYLKEESNGLPKRLLGQK